MPIYEYRCESCSHELEAIQKLADAPLTECPQCGKAALRKLVSAAGFRLKGSGWYETDFKSSDKKKNLVDGDKSATGKAEGKAEKADGKAEKSDGGATKTETSKTKTAAKSDTT